MRTEFTNTQKAGRIMRLLGWLTLIFVTVIAIAVALPAFATSGTRGLSVATILTFALLFLVSGLYLWVGGALKRHQGWARIVAAIISMLSLFNFPLGTILGFIILVFLVRGWSEKQGAV